MNLRKPRFSQVQKIDPEIADSLGGADDLRVRFLAVLAGWKTDRSGPFSRIVCGDLGVDFLDLRKPGSIRVTEYQTTQLLSNDGPNRTPILPGNGHRFQVKSGSD